MSYSGMFPKGTYKHDGKSSISSRPSLSLQVVVHLFIWYYFKISRYCSSLIIVYVIVSI